jgi:hypothetical protein
MKPAAWRTALLIVCAVAALIPVIVVVGQTGAGGAAPWYGMYGAVFDGSGKPYQLVLRSVDPGGPIARAGVRQGDLVDFRSLSLVERFSLMGQPLEGRPLPLSIQRGSSHLTAAVVPNTIDFKRWWGYLLVEVGSLWLLGFAALIAWRRAFVGENLLLATVLALVSIGFISWPGYFAAPWAWPYVLMEIIGLALPLSVAAWATFASGFARPLSTTRRFALWACYAFTAVFLLVGSGATDLTSGIIPLIGTLTLWFDPVFFIGPQWDIASDLAVLSALVCSALAVFASRDVDRQRAAWSLFPLAVLFAFLQLYEVASEALPYSGIILWFSLESIVIILTPVALTYVALNRRLIDIGFVLNRTVVFAVVSTIVIGAFVLVEWAASEWFAGASHQTSAVIGMVVALGLGLSLRFIHRYVDRFVDRVFFRQRHEDEAALRRFAHEAAYISDRSVLLERALSVVRRHVDADGASILVRDGAAGYVVAGDGVRSTVSPDDPGIVGLRAWGRPVDLSSLEDSALRGEFAFPMISRGDLVGVLVCGPKRDGEAYAPDESDALSALASGVGTALDTLSGRGDSALESLRATQAAILERLAVVAERQDEIVRRLG